MVTERIEETILRNLIYDEEFYRKVVPFIKPDYFIELQERVYDGEIFKLEEHTNRLFYSAKRMDLKIPFTKEVINEHVKKLFK